MTRVRKWRRLVLECLERRDVPSFGVPQAFLAGRAPADVVSADFNGDGHFDVAAANQASPGFVNVLLGTGPGTFQVARSFPSGGLSATSLAVADVSGDGRLDIVVTNSNTDTVAVLRGSGTGVFRRPVSYPAGDQPTSLKIADFNGDGIHDLAVVNLNSGASVLLGLGNGAYQAPVKYDIEELVKSIEVEDFNADGRPDLVVVGNHNAFSKVAVLLGNGNGSFSFGAQYFEGGANDVATGYFDGDSDVDLAVVNTDGTVIIRLGNGDGTFQLAATYPAGGQVVESADLNGDGDLDLVAMIGGALDVLLGNGDGTFDHRVQYPSGGNALAAAIQDFTGDGIFDIAIANSVQTSGTVTLQVGSGGGTFTGLLPPEIPFTGLHTMGGGDLNGDGDLDLVFTKLAGFNGGFGTAEVYLGAAGDDFQAGPVFPIYGTDPADMTFADFNSDGNLDVTIVFDSNQVSFGVALGRGDGSVITAPVFPAGSYANALAMGDFNVDGNPDLVVSNYEEVSVLLGNGDGSFQSPVPFPAGVFPHHVAVGDVNNDGKPDIAAANLWTEGTASVLLGNGDGTFQAPVSVAVGQDPRHIVLTDINTDGNDDMVTANIGSANVSVLLGNGDGTFQEAAHYATDVTPVSVAVGDLNGDGDLDLVTANFASASHTVSVLLGNGDGSFQSPLNISISTFAFPDDVDLGDLNGDGVLDLVVVRSSGVAALLGNGDGTFQNPVNYSEIGPNPEQATLADFNGDGRLDIATADTHWMSVYVGNGDGTFQEHVRYFAGLESYDGFDYSGVAAGDVDNDGDIDLVGSSRTNEKVAVLASTGGGFAAFAEYKNTDNLFSRITTGDFNSDGIVDLALPCFGMHVNLGNGDGTFRPAQFTPTHDLSIDAVAADFNGDGNLDLAAANYGEASTFAGTLFVLFGNGDGTFQPPATYVAGIRSVGVVAGDFDSDGDMDVAVVNQGQTSFTPTAASVSVFLNIGDGTFTSQTVYTIAQRGASITSGDVTGDGILDLVVTSFDNGIVSLLQGNGDGTFNGLHYAVGPGVENVIVFDVDQDTWLDIIVERNDGVAVLLNDGVWPPLPIGDGSKPHAPLHISDTAEELHPTTTEERAAIGEPMNRAGETETAPQRKYPARSIARVALAETADAAFDLLSTELQ